MANAQDEKEQAIQALAAAERAQKEVVRSLHEHQREEAEALGKEVRRGLVWSTSVLFGLLLAIGGFFGRQLWWQVDDNRTEVETLSSDVAVLNAKFDGFKELVDLRFTTLSKDIERSRAEILHAVASIQTNPDKNQPQQPR